ncbi:MAG: redoxin domain-containing protein [Prevotella sp.]|nr:redoxin domain-containing protein [Prevotella sp.]
MYRILLTIFIISMKSFSYADNVSLKGTIIGGVCNTVRISFPFIGDDGKYAVHEDTVGVVEGRFVYTTVINGLTLANLWYDDKQYPIILFLGKGETSVEIDLRYPYRYTQSGLSFDEEIAVFREYMQADDSLNIDILERYNSSLSSLNNKYNKMHIDKIEWDVKRNTILEDCERLLNSKTGHLLDFCKTHESFKITAGLLYEYLDYVPSMYEKVDSMLFYISNQVNNDNMMRILKSKIKQSAIIYKCKESPIGAIAPDFKGTTHDRRKVSLHDFHGQYVLLHIGLDDILNNFSNSIISELRNINMKKNSLDLEIISINRYSLSSDKELRKEKINWIIIDDDQINRKTMREVTPVSDMYPIRSLPQFFLIDRKGIIIYEWNGLYNYPTLGKIQELVDQSVS